MAGAERHNDFVGRAVQTVGTELLAQGEFAEQMVALESLTTGLFVLMICAAGKSRREADAFLSGLNAGVRERLHEALHAQGVE